MKYPVTLFWIGYSRGPNSNQGPWVSNHFGSPDIISKSLWEPGQPDGDFSSKYCVYSINGTSWGDRTCTGAIGVICEIDTRNKLHFYSMPKQ